MKGWRSAFGSFRGLNVVNQWTAPPRETRHIDVPTPMMLTHDPFQPTPDSADWDPKTTGEAAKRDVKHFPEMTTFMDKLVGQLVAKLDECQVRDNRLVIFLGDNDTLGSVTSRFQGADVRGGKGRTTHRGTHVPCIASWPAVIKPGRVNGDLIGATDFFPRSAQPSELRRRVMWNRDGPSYRTCPQIFSSSLNIVGSCSFNSARTKG